ncbi:MAG: hypothetical protein PF442_04825 [Desulfobulbaceae bacterium]|jgi:cytochrome c5|nr:hypothetical protein [Desulfobulbaceae bacterium]
MKKTIICLVGSALIAGSGIALAAETSAQDAKPLFEQKCSMCHSIEKPKSMKKTGSEWEATVMRMKNGHGAQLTDAEAKLIIEYLSKNYGS